MYYEGPFEIDLCKIWNCETSKFTSEGTFGKLLQDIYEKLKNVEEDIDDTKEQSGGRVVIL